MNNRKDEDFKIGFYYRLNKINKISKAAKYKFKALMDENVSKQDREIADSAFFAMMQDMDKALDELNESYSELHTGAQADN